MVSSLKEWKNNEVLQASDLHTEDGTETSEMSNSEYFRPLLKAVQRDFGSDGCAAIDQISWACVKAPRDLSCWDLASTSKTWICIRSPFLQCWHMLKSQSTVIGLLCLELLWKPYNTAMFARYHSCISCACISCFPKHLTAYSHALICDYKFYPCHAEWAKRHFVQWIKLESIESMR